MCAQLQTPGTTPSQGENRVELPADVVEAVQRDHRLLRGLLAVAAGFTRGFTACAQKAPGGLPQATLIFCIKGTGWWKAHGRLSIIRKGDLLVLPPGASHSCGPQASSPWIVHWVRAAGEHLPLYLHELALGPQTPVLHLGEELQLVRIFNEILYSLQHSPSFANLLQASHALAYLLSGLIQRRHDAVPESTDNVQRIAQAIVYMSEQLDEPLRVAAIARQAGLSSAHFGELFKNHTGCSPRDYLHLLRIHQACRLLRDSPLSVKEIAARIGYRDPLHFSRQFKAFQGVSPSQYRGESSC